MVSKPSNVFFVLDRVKTIKTKKGDDMAFITMSDDTDSMEGTIFTKVYNECANYLVAGKAFVASGKLEMRNNKKQFIIDKIFVNNN